VSKNKTQQTRQGKKRSSWDQVIMELFVLYLTLKELVPTIVRARQTFCGSFYISIISINYSLPAPWKTPSSSPIGVEFCCPDGRNLWLKTFSELSYPFTLSLI